MSISEPLILPKRFAAQKGPQSHSQNITQGLSETSYYQSQKRKKWPLPKTENHKNRSKQQPNSIHVAPILLGASVGSLRRPTSSTDWGCASRFAT